MKKWASKGNGLFVWKTCTVMKNEELRSELSSSMKKGSPNTKMTSKNQTDLRLPGFRSWLSTKPNTLTDTMDQGKA